MPKVSRVPVPGEVHPYLGAFDYVLFPEEKRVWPQGGAASLRNEVAVEELRQVSAFSPPFRDEMASVSVVECQEIGAGAIPLRIHELDKPRTLGSEVIQVWLRDYPFQDEITLFPELPMLYFRDANHLVIHSTSLLRQLG